MKEVRMSPRRKRAIHEALDRLNDTYGKGQVVSVFVFPKGEGRWVRQAHKGPQSCGNYMWLKLHYAVKPDRVTVRALGHQRTVRVRK